MTKIAFVGFGEVNTPIDIIVDKCKKAAESLKTKDTEVFSVYPITDDAAEKDVQKAIAALKKEEFDVLVLCIAGWIPTHAVVKVTEPFRHKPMVLWGLCGWMEGDRLVTTADQAGTSALRKTFFDLGYTFTYIYDIIGQKSKYEKVLAYATAAKAAEDLRSTKIGFMGYRDMNLYGRCIHRRQSIPYGHAGMGICRRIDDHTVIDALCLLNHGNYLTLYVRLIKIYLTSQLLCLTGKSVVYRLHSLIAVDTRFTLTQHIDVRSVDHKNLLHMSPHENTLSLYSAI